jgi:hypothetical protein
MLSRGYSREITYNEKISNKISLIAVYHLFFTQGHFIKKTNKPLIYKKRTPRYSDFNDAGVSSCLDYLMFATLTIYL